jgi:lipopolysaccharide transport system ATP-binding protein
MEEVGNEGRTILFVSHNLGVLQTLCTSGILLKHGEVIADSTASEAVIMYLRTLEQSVSNNLLERTDRRGKGDIRVSQIEVSTGEAEMSEALAIGRPARFIFHLTQIKPNLLCSFTLYDQHGQPVTNFNSASSIQENQHFSEAGGKLVCIIDELLLLPGRYRMNVALSADGELQDHIEAAVVMEVEQGHLRGQLVTSATGYGNVCFPHQWSLMECPATV